MIELEVLEDIRNYKSKIIGPFTIKEFFSLLIAVLLDVFILIYIVLPLNLPVDYLAYICIIPDVLIYEIGFRKVMGMIPMEKFLKTALIYNVLAAKNRKAKNSIKINNPSSKGDTGAKKRKISKKEQKLHPEYIAYQ